MESVTQESVTPAIAPKREFVKKPYVKKDKPNPQKKRESRKRYIYVTLLNPENKDETLINTSVRTLKDAYKIVNEKLESLNMQHYIFSKATFSLLMNFDLASSNRKFKAVGFEYLTLNPTKLITRQRKNSDTDSSSSSEIEED